MRPARALIPAAALVLALAGCTVTTHSSSCKGNVCAVSFTGEQILEVGATDPQRKLDVEKIESDAVTVSVLSDRERIKVGQSAAVGSMTVRVASIDSGKVTLGVTLN